MRRYWVYILSNRTRRLYVGLTDNLTARVREHKERRYQGSHTHHYNIDQLVYYETMADATIAGKRELQLKGYSRAKKINLIEARNPGWQDLTDTLSPG